jgi:dihydropteroate synthase
MAAGVAGPNILVDPGIGFAKTIEHNLEILARCGELRAIAPVVIGASRKAFIGHLTGHPAGPARAIGSLAAVEAAFRGGAAIVRVHDIAPTIDFLKVLAAIEQRRQPATDNRPRPGGGRS